MHDPLPLRRIRNGVEKIPHGGGVPRHQHVESYVTLAGALELASIAQDLGFADQAHMTRAVKWLTGRTPAAWRREKALSTSIARV